MAYDKFFNPYWKKMENGNKSFGTKAAEKVGVLCFSQ